MRFLLDTNVLFKSTEVSRLAEHARRNRHLLCVSALSHAERIAQLRRDKGVAFNAALVETYIRTHRIEVIPFDRHWGERAAEHLAERFPTLDAWQNAKWHRCAAAMGIDRARPGARRCPATVDWFIAVQGMTPDTVLVTEDGGDEFDGLPRVALVRALEIAAETPA